MNLTKLIANRFGDYKVNGPWLNVNCPYCILYRPARGKPDREYKLGLNLETGWFSCFRCGVKGRLSDLLPQAAALEAVDEPAKALEPLPKCQNLTQLDYPWNELVGEFLERKNFTKEALCDRVFFVEDYRKGKFIYGPALLFPITQFGCYRGFQVRTIYNHTNPKYCGASGMDRRSILYNYDRAFSQSDRLVVTEGFFDCLRVGDTAIATLGKSITANQLRLIRLGDFKQVIVFLDKDADDKAAAVAKELAVYFETYVARPVWKDGKKDPGDLTQDELNEVFETRLERSY